LLTAVAVIAAQAQCPNGIAKTEVTSMLAAHNNLRSLISSGKFMVKGKAMPAATKPIPNLKWDCKLEKAAQAVANTCKVAAPTKKTIGQNVYLANSTTTFTTVNGQFSTAASAWSGEFAKFGWPTVNYTSAVAKLGVSEATQMVWSGTKSIGCGVALCSGKKSALVICRYKTGGNKRNKNVYAHKPVSG
ncbi:hypothetical protein PFISCL1PPCAC_14470, partial [Pristionchus fissidentatus]